jgi:hypothetical protein
VARVIAAGDIAARFTPRGDLIVIAAIPSAVTWEVTQVPPPSTPGAILPPAHYLTADVSTVKLGIRLPLE